VSIPPDRAADLELARHTALEAGEAILPYFRRPAEVRYKSPDQPVTEADLVADRIVRERLTSARPDYGWLSEESAASPDRLARERVWMVDPIDGTRSFIEGRAEFAISIGLAEAGRPVLGVLCNPATGDVYHAVAGGGAFRNGTPIRVTRADPVRVTVLASRSEIARGDFDRVPSGWRVEPLGSTTWKMARIADGTGDLFLSRGPKSEWDLCAAALLVEEAGGVVTDLAGGALHFNQRDPSVHGTIAAAEELHRAVLAWLETAAPRSEP
jgi:myo-inositol-1(or 4)-monophosphatase